MSAPILFIAVPLLVAPLLFLMRRMRAVSTGLAVAVAVLLTWLALALPLGEPAAWLGGAIVDNSVSVLGRPFEIEAGDRLALAFVFAQAALLFLVSATGEPGDLFLPAGLGSLGLLAAALFVRPFLFAALFLQLASAMTVFMLASNSGQPGRSQPSTRGALRFLVFATLGLPFILLTGWLLEANAASPGDLSFAAQATILLMFGFAVLLSVAPFHSWVPAVAEHAPPFAAAFAFSVMRLAVIFLLLTFLDSYTWLGQNPVVYRALTLAGGAMALVGALFVFGQRDFGRSMGYVMLIDFGAVMLGIGLGTRAGIQAALITLALRGLALPLWAMGLDQLRRAAGSDSFEALRGCARRYPFSSAAVIVGMLSVAGFPLTAGFVGRWGLLYQLAQIHPTAAVLVLLGTAAVGLVCARGLAALLALPETAQDAPRLADSVPAPVGRFALGLYGLGFVVMLGLGIFPQWLLPVVADTASAFTQHIR